MQIEGSLPPSQRPIISPDSLPIYSLNLHNVYPMLFIYTYVFEGIFISFKFFDQNRVLVMTNSNQESQKLLTTLLKNSEPYFLVWTIHYLERCK